MTRTSCIRLLQMDAVVGDFDANLRKLADAAESARQDGVSILIAPELALTGYPPEDLLLRPALIDKLNASESRLCEISQNLTLMVGAPIGALSAGAPSTGKLKLPDYLWSVKDDGD